MKKVGWVKPNNNLHSLSLLQNDVKSESEAIGHYIFSAPSANPLPAVNYKITNSYCWVSPNLLFFIKLISYPNMSAMHTISLYVILFLDILWDKELGEYVFPIFSDISPASSFNNKSSCRSNIFICFLA